VAAVAEIQSDLTDANGSSGDDSARDEDAESMLSVSPRLTAEQKHKGDRASGAQSELSTVAAQWLQVGDPATLFPFTVVCLTECEVFEIPLAEFRSCTSGLCFWLFKGTLLALDATPFNYSCCARC